MPDVILELIQRDPETVIRFVAVLFALIGANGLRQVLRRSSKDADAIRQRGSKDADIIRQTLARREERLDELEDREDEQAKEHVDLMARLVRAEAERDLCKEDARRKDALIEQLQSNRNERTYED